MISTRIHGILDYVVGLVLIFSPWVFGFAVDGVEVWIPTTFGALIILYSLFTRYELGVVKSIRVPTHLILDGIGGAFLAVSPWLFDFASLVWIPHLVLGLLILVAALFTRHIPERPLAAGAS